ncbi:MAG: pdhD [Firmicutes bacterium]|nr:pdhD [Bacillota bacterium]
MVQYDVVVIGGGPGGYVAAVRASQLGFKTALIEKDQLGGTCVNWGCIPTKSLLRNSEVVHLLSQERSFGFQCGTVSVDYASAFQRSRQVAKRQGKRVEILLKNRNVTVLKGEARFIDQTTIELQPSGETVSAKNIIIATGAKPRSVPGIDLDGETIITAREALALDKVPASVLIVGAGPIGMEIATLWNRYGAKVTAVEMMPYVLPSEDEDVCREAAAQFAKAGIQVKTGVKVSSVVKTPAGVEVTVLDGEVQEKIVVEKVLVATGFAPQIAQLGLEAIGVATNRGRIEIDEQMRTSVANIYAIGDTNGKMGLAHVASAQGMIAAEAIANKQTQTLVYENIPRCIFSTVEVASVGLTEKQAKERGYEIKTVQSPFVPNGKALAMNENAGFVKLIADAQTDKLLGAHMIGPHVTELIAGPATMIALGATTAQLSQVVYPHPTLSEAVVEGLHVLAGHGVHL